MIKVKHFKKSDLDFSTDQSDSAIHSLVNVGNSSHLGAGIGVFAAGCNMEWTVSYDEVLFIHSGNFSLLVGKMEFTAEAGDVLWIPAGTELVYAAEKDVTFFYAVYPVDKSPSTSVAFDFPETAPQTSLN